MPLPAPVDASPSRSGTGAMFAASSRTIRSGVSRVVDFDRLGDQLLVGQLHSHLLESVEKQRRSCVELLRVLVAVDMCRNVQRGAWAPPPNPGSVHSVACRAENISIALPRTFEKPGSGSRKALRRGFETRRPLQSLGRSLNQAWARRRALPLALRLALPG
jgi:hypothetical protein